MMLIFTRYYCKDDDVWAPSVSSGYLASDSLTMHFSLYTHAWFSLELEGFCLKF